MTCGEWVLTVPTWLGRLLVSYMDDGAAEATLRRNWGYTLCLGGHGQRRQRRWFTYEVNWTTWREITITVHRNTALLVIEGKCKLMSQAHITLDYMCRQLILIASNYIWEKKLNDWINVPARVPLLFLLTLGCLSSSDVEEAVQEEEPHFLLTVVGMLQLSKYL